MAVNDLCYSTDEGITENMLKAIQTYIGLCGLLDMRESRNAFITAVCRGCLPSNYNLAIFSGTGNTCCSTQQSTSVSYNSSATMYEDQVHHLPQQYNTTSSYGPETTDYKQVVVAVGTPLASFTTPSMVMQQTLSSTGKITI